MKFSTALSFAAVAFRMSGVSANPEVARKIQDDYLTVRGSAPVTVVAEITEEEIKAQVNENVVAPMQEIAKEIETAIVGGATRRDLQVITLIDGEYVCFFDMEAYSRAMLVHPYDPTVRQCLDGLETIHFETWYASCTDPTEKTSKDCQYWETVYHVHIEYPGTGDETLVLPDGFDDLEDWGKDAILRSIETNKGKWYDVKATFATQKEVWAAEGDPHFMTWSGEWFDFMGACDLKLVNAPVFDGESALDVNIRTKIRNDYSYIENVAVKLGEDTLEVASFGDYWLNGVQTAKLPATVGGYPVAFSKPTAKLSIFTIEIDNAETIVIKAFKDIVSVKFVGVDSARFGGSLGMIGSYDMNGKLIARDGKTEIFDPIEFANEWQIRQDEPMLFQSAVGPQHPTQCQMPDPVKSKGRRLGETIAIAAAEKVCAKYAPNNQDACVHDVMAYGDLDLASAGAA